MASRDKKEIFIYCLIDPISNLIRYVGKTNDLSKRYSHHNRCVVNTHTRNWIYSLKEKGKKPLISVLDTATESDWAEKEIAYIKLLKSCGAKLTNQTQGGDKGVIYTDYVRIKMSNAQKGKVVSKETREKLSRAKRGIPMKEESKIKISIANSGRVYSDDIISKMQIWNIRNPSIIQYDKNGEKINEWVSAADAERKMGYTESCILRCCKKERKTHHGFIWKFK